MVRNTCREGKSGYFPRKCSSLLFFFYGIPSIKLVTVDLKWIFTPSLSAFAYGEKYLQNLQEEWWTLMLPSVGRVNGVVWTQLWGEAADPDLSYGLQHRESEGVEPQAGKPSNLPCQFSLWIWRAYLSLKVPSTSCSKHWQQQGPWWLGAPLKVEEQCWAFLRGLLVEAALTVRWLSRRCCLHSKENKAL